MRGQMHHLDLTVRDIGQSAPFYETVLGFLGYRCVKSTDDIVVWDLVLTSPDSYRWHRTDWPARGYTPEVVRCGSRAAR